MNDTQTLDETGIADLANFMDTTANDVAFLDHFQEFSRSTAATLRACLAGEVEPADAEQAAQAWVYLAKIEIARRDRIGELSDRLHTTADPGEWRALLIEVAGLMSDGHIAETMAEFHLDLAMEAMVDLPDIGALMHNTPDQVQ